MYDDSEVLILRLRTSWVGAVGYGNLYRGRVEQVLSGKLSQDEITITVLAGDKQKDAFLSSRPETAVFEMGCHQSGRNEHYSMLPFSGFVDEERNSWEIDYLKELFTADAAEA